MQNKMENSDSQQFHSGLFKKKKGPNRIPINFMQEMFCEEKKKQTEKN